MHKNTGIPLESLFRTDRQIVSLAAAMLEKTVPRPTANHIEQAEEERERRFAEIVAKFSRR
jgi:hypothetical protein